MIGPLPPPVGGATRHFATLAEDLAANPRFSLKLFNTSRGSIHHSNPLRNLVMAARAFGRLLIDLWRVDIVSFHASDRGMFMMAPLVVTLAKLARKPVVLRVFGGSYGDFYEKQGRIGRALSRRFVLGADVVLLQTKRAIRQLEGRGQASLVWFSTYIKVASRPEPVAAIAPDARCSRFVFLGHMWRTKGVETMLELAGRLPPTISLDLFGPLDEYTATQLNERGGSRIRYRGELSHAEVDRRLWEYDCLLLPTFHPGEGYPGVIAEAFAHGLPVISTRWLAIPEIVDDSCGVLIEPEDSAGLLAAMLAMHDDRNRWLRLKRGATQRASDFTHEVWARRFEEICESLVRRPGARPQ